MTSKVFTVDNINWKGNNLLHNLGNVLDNKELEKHMQCCNLVIKLLPDQSLLNLKNEDGYTPAHSYCYGKKTNYILFEILLNNGAIVRTWNNKGIGLIHTMAIYGTENGINTVYRYDNDIINLKTKDEEQTPLMISILNRNIEVANTLIDMNCNIDTTDIYGNTALHYACMNSLVIIIKKLLVMSIGNTCRSVENCFGMTHIDYARNKLKMVFQYDRSYTGYINMYSQYRDRNEYLSSLELVSRDTELNNRIVIDRNKINRTYEFIFTKLR